MPFGACADDPPGHRDDEHEPRTALPQRWGSALVDVFGVACVVAPCLSSCSPIVATYREMMLSNADGTTLLVMKSSAGAENESSVTGDEADSIETEVKAIDAGRARLAGDVPLHQPEAAECIRIRERRAPRCHR